MLKVTISLHKSTHMNRLDKPIVLTLAAQFEWHFD